jgi:hypothetical protein
LLPEPTPSPRLWATAPGATPVRLCEHTMRVSNRPSKPELSTWLETGTFYLAPTITPKTASRDVSQSATSQGPCSTLRPPGDGGLDRSALDLATAARIAVGGQVLPGRAAFTNHFGVRSGLLLDHRATRKVFSPQRDRNNVESRNTSIFTGSLSMPGLHIREFSPLVEKCGAPHFWTNRAGHHSTRCRTSDPARQPCSITYST